MIGRIMVPKDLWNLCYCIWQKRLFSCEEVTHFEMSRIFWIILVNSISLHASLKLEKLLQCGKREGAMTMEEWSEKCNTAGFEDGRRRPRVKEYRCSLQTGKRAQP